MEILNINLPKKKDEVLILVYLPYGYLNENDTNFGLAHLTEHYITTLLEKKYNPLDIDATINDNEITLYFSFKKKDFDKFDNGINQILDDIKDLTKNVDKTILNNEKKRVEIELEEKYSEVLNEISYGIENKIISKPNRLKRSRIEQIKNIKQFKVGDVVKCINKLLKLEPVFFVGYNGNTDIFAKKKINKLPKICLSKKKTFVLDSDNKVLKKSDNFAIVFPLYNLYKNIADYYSLQFLAKKIHTKFTENILSLGVYKTEYQYDFNIHGGYIWFFSNSYKKNNENLEEIFFDSVKEYLESKDLERDFKEFKDNLVKGIKLDWNNFYYKFDWIVDDFIQKGKVIELDVLVDKVSNISLKDLKRVTRRVFVKGEAKVGKK